MRNFKMVLFIALVGIVPAIAEMPVSALDYKSVGVSYSFEMAGFTTSGDARTSSMMHLGGFNYAPIPYLMFGLKFGGASATTNDALLKTSGDPGFAFQGGVSLFTPEFASILQVVLGSDLSTFSSDHDDGSVTIRTVDSRLGLSIDAMRFINFELGAKYNYIFGKSTLPQYDGMEIESENPMLGYVQFTLHNPQVGAFLLLGGD